MKELLAVPEPVDEVEQAVAQCGEFANWTLGRQLWYLRRYRKLTQAELARRSGVTQTRISELEKGGDAKVSTLRALFAAMDFGLLVLPEQSGRGKLARPDQARKAATTSGTLAGSSVSATRLRSGPQAKSRG